MLNATKVESLIRKGQSVFIGDDTGSRNVGRLYLRVRPRKKGTTAEWIVQWFSVGQKRRMKLDNADPEGRKGLTLHGARERFSEISSMIRKGFNPKEETDRQAAEERDRREAEEQRRIVDEKANLTFGELMENRYIPWAKSSKKHWIDDENRYNNHLKPLLKDHRLGEIDVSLLYDVRDHLYQKGLAPATVKHCLVIIRQAYNKFSLWGLWHGANPVRANAGLIPRLNNSRLRTLTDEEERKLLSALWEKSPAVHDMAVISLYGGLRFGEIASLHWEDISFVNRRIYIHGKGGRERGIPMNQRLLDVLTRLRKERDKDSGYVFPNRKGEKQKWISHTYSRVVEDLALNKDQKSRYHIDFHSLRHTFATRMAAAGTPLTVLRDLLGHADLTMVSRYSHLAPSEAESAMARLDKKDRCDNHSKQVASARFDRN